MIAASGDTGELATPDALIDACRATLPPGQVITALAYHALAAAIARRDAAWQARLDAALYESSQHAGVAQALERRLAAAERELERWRHGVTIEGDFVCPDSLALNTARTALGEIAARRGAYSRDPLTHAQNTINNMEALALDALDALRAQAPRP